MLEHQVLKIRPGDIDQHDAIFVQLGLKATTGAKFRINELVLKEGFSSTNVVTFARELRRRLERLNRVHFRIAG